MNADLTFEEWRQTLRSFCGNFEVTPGAERPRRHGRFDKLALGGMEMSHINTNYESITRDTNCIRRDDVDCLYLVRQIQGRMAIKHGDHECTLDPGDCVLLDSRRPLTGRYQGSGVEFATLHVPRNDIFRGDHADIAIGATRKFNEARGQTLHSALNYVSRMGLAEDTGRGFIVDLARLVFRRDPRRHSLQRFDRAEDRVTALLQTIDRNATDQDFSLAALAQASGMSARQVQRDLQGSGTNFSRELLRCRMSLVRRALNHANAAGQRPHIAQIAYSAGFNDLSNFNRAFRREHGCTPIEYTRERTPLSPAI